MVDIMSLVIGLFILFTGTYSQEQIIYSCKDGWTNIGPSCYKLFGTSTGFSWEQAQKTCKGLGSYLVDIDDYDQRKKVGNFAKAGGAEKFWTGLNRKDVDDSVKYKMGEMMASVYEGRWAVKQPDSDHGDCVYQMMQDDKYRNTLAKCKVKMAFVCQINSCPTESFHCFNGKCVNSNYTCDNFNDCGDYSDEADCSSHCRYLESTSGTFTSPGYPTAYNASKVCTWTLIGPEGTNMFLNITKFDTEKNQDLVDIFVGGSTESTSIHHAQLTGSVNNAQYRSWNNFMIVRFMTDAEVQKSGFTATFSSIKDNMPMETNLTATNATQMLVPLVFSYDGNDGSTSRLGNTDTVWIITSEHRRKIITLKRIKIDLRLGDSLEIHDGNSAQGPMLAKYTMANNDGVPLDLMQDKPSTGPEYVFSTEHQIYIILRTSSASVSGKAFEIQYWEGCDAQYTTSVGQLFSPGYLYKLNYANFQTCTWAIKSPVFGRGITLHIDSDNGIEEKDYLEIFTEKNNDSGRKRHGNTIGFSNTTISTALTSYSSNGEMFLRFKTNAISNERGFHAVYSIDCENPAFNAMTDISGPQNWRYRDTINVTCKNGYTFSSEKFDSYVVMTCQIGGTWSTRTIPRCQPVYCGMPSPVSNAYIARTTGPGFNSIATYQCYPGFTLNGNANVTCQADAKWSSAPTCQGAVCSAPADISHGSQKIIRGTKTEYASIIEYTCTEGYELVGDPIIFCKSDSTWTNSVPTCKKLKCPVPQDDHGNYTGSLGSREIDQNIFFECDAGFAFSDGSKSKTLLCHKNQTFEPFGNGCENIDECTALTHGCEHKCIDTIGSYKCECKEGFTLDTNNKTCSDINECNTDNGGCDQLCNNNDGGYKCSCNLEGYVLFTADGTSGYKLQNKENGLLSGDVYRLNHSCVLKQCQNPPASVSNGVLLSLRTVHRVGDIVEYMCNLGYTNREASVFTCGSDGQWSPSAWPTCNVAVCPPASLTGVTNKPVLAPSSGSQKYLESLNMTCSQFRPTPYMYQRQCLYNIKKNAYELFGAPYECEIIDCGIPKTQAGTKRTYTTTTYGSSFVYTCLNLHTLSGKSVKGDNIVRCEENGQWDFGDLHCVGAMCDDPGTPAGGSQVISDGYQLNAEVMFKCDRSDYSPDRTTGISCVLNATQNGLKWNDTIPSCVDTEAPMMFNCTPEQQAKLYTVVSLIKPYFTDNTGLKSVTVTPEYADYNLVLTNGSPTRNVQYKATDWAGNVKVCSITVSAQDTEPPTIACPQSKVEYITDTDTGTRPTLATNAVTATDNKALANKTVTPTSVSVSPSSLKSNIITVTATDTAGLSISCQYDVVVRANPCSPLSLVNPLNGNKNCSAKSGGYICDVTCNSGFVLYSGLRSQRLECSTNNAWNPEALPACVSDSNPAEYMSVHTVVYSNLTNSPTCHQAYQTDIKSKIPDFVRSLHGCQDSGIQEVTLVDNVSFAVDSGGALLDVNMTLVYKPNNLPLIQYLACKDLMDHKFATIKFGLIPLSTISPENCNIATGNAENSLDNGFRCTAGTIKNVNGKETCLTCPPGTYSSGSNTCTLCPKGQYQSATGQNSCTPCGSKSTLYVGSTSPTACVVEQCSQGFISSTGYPPCSQCPKNTYWTNSTSCTPCNPGDITLTTGATARSFCRAPCGEGKFSYNGYEASCADCPKNFFQTSKQQKTCSECSDSHYTTNEGSKLLTDCIDAMADLCTTNKPCVNGNCSIVNHDYKCTCNAGHTGRNCDTQVDHCKSNPCYHGGACTQEINGFKCNCPKGTSGPRCEVDLDTECSTSPCQNGGKCQNLFGTYKCVCASGFTGTNCSSQQDVCTKAPLCSNEEQCVPHNNIRKTCKCKPGYTGELCEKNIDDCASNPCFYGSTCIDEPNDFRCQCNNKSYGGENCHIRKSLCATTDKCKHGGRCVEDYTKDTFRCICPPHYTYGEICQFEVHTNSKINLKAGSQQEIDTMKGCHDLCIVDCIAVSYETSTKTCNRYSENVNVANILADANTHSFIRKCSKVEDSFWTPWYDIDDPTSSPGDTELRNALDAYNISVCNNSEPIRAECRVKGTNKMSSQTGNSFKVKCGIQGLECQNIAGNQCEDYEVRYECASHRVFDGVTCSPKDYCTPSPCKNNGVCKEDSTSAARFQCACHGGWTGSLCQHSVDDCKADSCHNNGTCVDKHNSVECKCPAGFSGDTCQTNDNNCSPDPCDNAGSSGCVDGINDYTCNCRPGFTGKKCETNIDECYSNPCLHGGKCEDRENDFFCICASGWEGKRCQIVSNQCTSDKPCPSSAQCSNLFADFYCACPTGTYGKKCEKFPDLCQDSNPCLNSAQCSVNVSKVSCKCSSDHTGAGCQTIIDHCGKPDQCKNGGTCITKSPVGFECKCPKGYSGTSCEVNVNDCDGVTCQGGATCIDMISQYFCRCPLKKTGENCAKNLNLNYDLDFFLPSRTGYAALQYPIKLSGDDFSFSLWIKFYEKDQTGNVMTIFTSDSANSFAKVSPMIDVTHEGVVVYEGSLTKKLSHKYADLNDGQWHYVTVMWDSSEGMNLLLDGISQEKDANIYKNMVFNKNIWVTLGSKFNTSTMMPIPDEGFRGHISQVNIYERDLSFTTESTTIINNPKITFPDLILAWNEYKLYRGVRYTFPSTAKKCGVNCIATAIARQGPYTNNCPKDVYVFDKERPPKVDWMEPVFQGAAAGKVKSNYRSGETFVWGKYQVTYEARDNKNNAAFCHFNVYVQYDNCSEPVVPYNGKEACKNMYKPYHGCVPSCNTNGYLIDRYTPNIFTCGPLGSWYPSDRYRPLRYPSCGRVTAKARKNIRCQLTYPEITLNDCIGTKETLKVLMREALAKIHREYSQSVCSNSNCTDVDVTIDCAASVAITVVTVKFSIPSTPAMWTQQSTGRQLRASDVMTHFILDDTVFDVSVRIPNGHLDPNGFVLEVTDVCDDNETVINGNCVKCGPGNFFNIATKICDDCPVGQFQDMYGQTSCKYCNQGLTTETVGSTSSSQCKANCTAGSYFSVDDNMCKPCMTGFYQEMPGKFYCLPCPAGNTTRGHGSNSSDSCKDDCRSGTELSPNGSCTPCTVGTYRTQGIHALCTSCRSDKTTLSTGSTSDAACDIISCNAGQKRVGINSCENCPIGTYQDQKWQTTCIPCGGERYRTDTVASTRKDQCKFFCPDGQQEKTSKLSCEDCAIGKYRNNSIDGYYVPCKPCGDNKLTLQTASTMKSQCVLHQCGVGEQPNSQNNGCDKCPVGTYQPKADQPRCLNCTSGQSTRNNGSTNVNQCEIYCQEGKEKVSNGSCVRCEVGFYKNNNADLFMNCTACPPDFVTANTSSVSHTECTVRKCLAGTKRKPDDKGCVDCPIGYYQDKPYQLSCIKCPTSNQSTRGVRSTSLSSCETYCLSGKEKTASGCVPCPRGYYKDNSQQGLFADCKLCEPHLITVTTGATVSTDCKIANCTAGQRRNNVTNSCEDCPIGYYQPDKWQDKCEQCPKYKTTVKKGTELLSDCHLQCNAGMEDVNGTCVKCKKGYFKEASGAGNCEPCKTNFTTAGTGTSAAKECNLPSCQPGTYLDVNKCKPCPYDKFQNEKEKTSCNACPGPRPVTLQTGAASEVKCVLDCSSGYEYQETPNDCVLCEKGYYRDKNDRSQTSCQMCDSDFITQSTGSDSSSKCNIRNCTEAGQYRDPASNTCKDCGIGTFNDKKWQDQCQGCSSGYTTQFTKSKSVSACKKDCPSGYQVKGDNCERCPKGSYRTKGATWTCQSCPDNTTTPSETSTSGSACSLSTCQVGQRLRNGLCEPCPIGSYQSSTGQMDCIPCSDNGITSGVGSTSSSDCKSYCAEGNNNCSANADCKTNPQTRFTCQCKPDYSGDGYNCTHKCDLGYCKYGNCFKDPLRCTCQEFFTGTRCDVRSDPSSQDQENTNIIIGSISAAAVLLLIILIVVACVVAASRKTPPPKYTDHDSFNGNASQLNDKQSLYNQTSRAPSVRDSGNFSHLAGQSYFDNNIAVYEA